MDSITYVGLDVPKAAFHPEAAFDARGSIQALSLVKREPPSTTGSTRGSSSPRSPQARQCVVMVWPPAITSAALGRGSFRVTAPSGRGPGSFKPALANAGGGVRFSYCRRPRSPPESAPKLPSWRWPVGVAPGGLRVWRPFCRPLRAGQGHPRAPGPIRAAPLAARPCRGRWRAWAGGAGAKG